MVREEMMFCKNISAFCKANILAALGLFSVFDMNTCSFDRRTKGHIVYEVRLYKSVFQLSLLNS